MGYLKFDKFTLADLGQSLQKELIIPNKLGAYYSTTSVGCNTRKYHGAFVVPSDIEGKEKLLLISSIEPSIISAYMNIQPDTFHQTDIITCVCLITTPTLSLSHTERVAHLSRSVLSFVKKRID